jgi:hypothetical protein
MARQEEDKEDLMREATALVRRVELALPTQEETCVIGFRRDGAASVFFGADLVLQFNTAGELRRAFSAGKLVKAEQARLVWLERVRTETEVQLRRREFTAEEQRIFVEVAESRLSQLQQLVSAAETKVLRQIPEGEDVLQDVEHWLGDLPRPLVIAARPHVGPQ